MDTNSPKKILIVEDEVALRTLLEDKFKAEGLEILSASTGAEGLNLALSNHPDLILLDLVMPEMDGVTMLKKLREDAWGKQVQVIILTNKEDSQSISDSLQSKVSLFLVKSDWNLDKLISTVKEKLLIQARL